MLGMFWVGAAYTVIVDKLEPLDMRLRSVKEESVASRLQSLKSFLYDDCSFFVSMMFVLRKHRGNLHGRKGIYMEVRRPVW